MMTVEQLNKSYVDLDTPEEQAAAEAECKRPGRCTQEEMVYLLLNRQDTNGDFQITQKELGVMLGVKESQLDNPRKMYGGVLWASALVVIIFKRVLHEFEHLWKDRLEKTIFNVVHKTDNILCQECSVVIGKLALDRWYTLSY